MNACMLSHFSHVRFCVTSWTAAHQAPLSTGFSRQEYGVGCHFLLHLICILLNNQTSACLSQPISIYANSLFCVPPTKGAFSVCRIPYAPSDLRALIQSMLLPGIVLPLAPPFIWPSIELNSSVTSSRIPVLFGPLSHTHTHTHTHRIKFP